MVGHFLDVLGEFGAALIVLVGSVPGEDLRQALHAVIVEIPVGGGADHAPVGGGVVGNAHGPIVFQAGIQVGGSDAALVAGAENVAVVVPVIDVLVAEIIAELVGGPLEGQQAGQGIVLVHQPGSGPHQLPLGLGNPVGVAVVVRQAGELQVRLVPAPMVILVDGAHAVGNAALAVNVAEKQLAGIAFERGVDSKGFAASHAETSPSVRRGRSLSL